ncbi:MAG: tetratricopeptide repeat protein [Magnetococcales bacterium]|nr:tetratricopeptide repeat protein [Magnetococcales bacterium]
MDKQKSQKNGGRSQLTVDEAYKKAIEYFDAGRYTEADQLCTAILRSVPEHINAINCLGLIAQKIDRHDIAVEQFQKAININSNTAFSFYNLGTSLFQLGNVEIAVQALQKAIHIKPNYAEAYHTLGNLFFQLGEQEKAIQLLQKAISIQPENFGLYNNLGNIFEELGRLDDADLVYQTALTMQPYSAELHNNIGIIKNRQGKQDEAVVNLQKAISLKPDFVNAHYNLGIILKSLGRITDAIARYRKVISLNPGFVEAHCNLILCIDLIADGTTNVPHIERKKWADQHSKPLEKYWQTLNNQPIPDRVLRVGYVGADFKHHSAAHIFSTVLLNHNPDKFQIFCYVGNEKYDDLTQQLKNISTGWLSTVNMADDLLAAKIKQDGIDILVDLAGHTKGNRLLTFARKPAPIQITAWGYPLGTAMRAMDYIFADPFIIPHAKRGDYVESIIDLPCVLHMQPIIPFPAVTDPPVITNGYVTFGAFNRLEKYNDEVYTLWAKILLRIPDAKLLIKTIKLDSPILVSQIQAFFQNLGVKKDRLILIGKTSRQEHLEAHAQVDIMLDPFPHPSGMASLESLRMGVPVLNCETKMRYPISSSILHILNMDDWRCASEDDYVAKAMMFANDIQYLKNLRHQLRNRFDESVLGNSKLYTATIEDIYLRLWKSWCER